MGIPQPSSVTERENAPYSQKPTGTVLEEVAPEASAHPSDVAKVGNAWVVQGAGTFQNRDVYKFQGNTLPAGLSISDYISNQRDDQTPHRVPCNPRFDPANVQIVGGLLNLTVPGGQKPKQGTDYALKCAEITTAVENILYASVRTRAIFSSVPGTCHGSLSRLFLLG